MLHFRFAVFTVAVGLFALQALSEEGEVQFLVGFGGATANDTLFDVAVDGEGSIYSVGIFRDTADIVPYTKQTELTSKGERDGFLQKVDGDGVFQWVVQIGGPDRDFARDVAVDPSGDVYVGGAFRGVIDFDPTNGVTELDAGAQDQLFVAKFSTLGALQWAIRIGDADVSTTFGGLDVDGAGNVYLAAAYEGLLDVDPGEGGTTLDHTSGLDMFLLKLDTNGNYVWVRTVGGDGNQVGGKVAVDAEGNAHVFGAFSGPAVFSEGPEGITLTPAGPGPFYLDDTFILKVHADNSIAWVHPIGNEMIDNAGDVALDEAGNVYLGGQFQGFIDFDPGAEVFFLMAEGSAAYVLKLTSGGVFVWARSWGGDAADGVDSIAVDSAGNVFSVGNFDGVSDMDPSGAVFELTDTGKFGGDAFVHKLDADGGFAYAFSASSQSSVEPESLVLDGQGNLIVGGSFTFDLDLSPLVGEDVGLTSLGLNSDDFLLKLTGAGDPLDLNGDGSVNAVDIQLVINGALGLPVLPSINTDVNGDNTTNALDIQLVINGALQG